VTEKAGRGRGIAAGVLLGLAILAIVLAPILLYVRTQLIDSEAFGDRTETALASADVQDYLADALTANLVAQAGSGAERAEPVVRAVVGGLVASDRFSEFFGRAAGALQERLLDDGSGERVIELHEGVDRAIEAIAVVRPQLAQRMTDASAEIEVGQGTAGEGLAQIAHLADQLRALAIVLPVLAFLFLVLSVAVAPDRLRAARRAGWGLVAGGVVVVALAGLTRSILLGVAEGTEARGAVGAAEEAFLADLGTWGAWIVAVGVVVLGTAVFLGSPLTLREQAARAWGASTSRPARGWVLALRLIALVVVVLLAIFALEALVKILVAVVIALVVAYGVAELLRLMGLGAGRPSGNPVKENR
jgi:hypothetical protein